MNQLENWRTVKGESLAWRHNPLVAENPVDAWQGLLEARGLHEHDDFFTPALANLPDPLEMKDMDKASNRLVQAVLDAEKVHVFGDFDCDGVSGTSILVEALRSIGLEVSYSIPHRADDGHGIGIMPVQQAFDAGVKLGLSVDTGTTCLDASDRAKELGFDLIITDHHLPDEILPNAFALLNPARKDCGFADRKLCGTGVAFFLLLATWKKLNEINKRPSHDLKQLLDRVAMATVADVMELKGVNRILVAYGLKQLRTSPSIGMSALLDSAKVNRSRISAQTIGFYLAPRINAAGRLAHGEDAMALLCSKSPSEAEQLASVLDDLNIQRRKIETDTYKDACKKLELQGESAPLAIYDSEWHAGVVGLVAGRLARQHGKPAAVGFIEPGGMIRISLRGVRGYHIGELLHGCAEYLNGFGGHAGAGGGSVAADSWHDFVICFQSVIAHQAKQVCTNACLEVDGILSIGALHGQLAKRLQRFEPVGKGNPATLWILKDVIVSDVKKLKGGVSRVILTNGVLFVQSVMFKSGALIEHLPLGLNVSVLGQIQVDTYRGGDAVQFVIEDVLEFNDAA